MMRDKTSTNRAFLKYILALVLFGSNGIVASHISLTSYGIVLMRTLLGSLLLITIFLVRREEFTFLNHKKQSVYIILSGIAMGASWMFLYEAYQQIGVSRASLLYYTGPVIVMALSPMLFHEKLTRSKVTGFIIVLIGIFLVNGQVLQEGKTSWGLLCGTMSALMYALMVIFNKKAEKITGLENSMIQLTISFLTAAVFVELRQGYAIQIAGQDLIPIAILGLINTGIGCYLYFSSIGHLKVQAIAVCGYLEPLSAVIFSVLLLSEVMVTRQIIGAVMIMGGAMFAERQDLY
jgi:drug/metabolite transporter (DMT)-like permease